MADEKKPTQQKKSTKSTKTTKKTTTKAAPKKTETKKAAPKVDKKKKTVKKKKSAPKIAKPVPSKKIKDMTPKEKKEFDAEVREYKEKVAAQKAEAKAEAKKLREKRSANFEKSKFGKLVRKVFPKKKKAPKLTDTNLSKSDIRKMNADRRENRKIKLMRKRAIGVVALCVVCSAVVLGGFKVVGALELNAGYAGKTGDTYFAEADVTKYITEQTFFKQYSKSLSK